MAQVGSLSVKLGLVTADFDRGVAGASQKAIALRTALDGLAGGARQLSGIFSALGGITTLAGVGLAGLAQQAFSLTDAIVDSSRAFGLSVPQVLAFREAIQASGGTADGADKIITKLFSAIEKGREGNEETISQFHRLGITFKELNTLAPDQLINRTFEAIAKIESKTTQVKAVRDLLGRAGIGISAEDVSAQLSKGSGAFDEYAKSIIKVGEVQDRLKASMTNLTIAFADLIAPFTGGSAVGIDTFKNILLGLGAVTVLVGLAKLVEVIRTLTLAWGAFSLAITVSPVGAIIALIGALTGLAYLAFQSNKDLTTTTASGNAPTSELDFLSPAVDANNYSSGKFVDPITTTSNKPGKAESPLLTSKAGGGGSDISPEQQALIQRLRITQEQGRLEQAMITGRAELIRLNEFDKKIVELGYETGKKALDIQQNREKELKANVNKPTLTKGINDVYDAELANLTAVHVAKVADIQLDQQRQYSYTFGWEAAFKKFSEDGDKASERGREAFNSITGNIDRALDNWVENAEFSFSAIGRLFSNLARDIIQDLIKIELKAQASSLFKAAGGFSGVGSLIGGLFSAGASAGGAPDVSSLAGYSLLAEGGTLQPGGKAIVGENGIEEIRAGSDGSVKVTPLSTDRGGSGVTINANNYIASVSAIDTQSFAQALAANKDYVYSANQSASRSVPGSR